MGQSVSAVEARQKLDEILNRVALRQEEIIIERAGGEKNRPPLTDRKEIVAPKGQARFSESRRTWKRNLARCRRRCLSAPGTGPMGLDLKTGDK